LEGTSNYSQIFNNRPCNGVPASQLFRYFTKRRRLWRLVNFDLGAAVYKGNPTDHFLYLKPIFIAYLNSENQLRAEQIFFSVSSNIIF